MAKKHPTFGVGDIVMPNLRGREEADLAPMFHVVTEVLRGPGMRVRPALTWETFKVMRKHFELFMTAADYRRSVEKAEAMKVANLLMAPEVGS